MIGKTVFIKQRLKRCQKQHYNDVKTPRNRLPDRAASVKRRRARKRPTGTTRRKRRGPSRGCRFWAPNERRPSCDKIFSYFFGFFLDFSVRTWFQTFQRESSKRRSPQNLPVCRPLPLFSPTKWRTRKADGGGSVGRRTQLLIAGLRVRILPPPGTENRW